MRSAGIQKWVFISLTVGLLISLPGQYREYYVFGKVVDASQQPLANVSISLRELSTSQSYEFKSNQKGEFKFVGLPHGVYKVSIKRDGYQIKEDEWRFEEPRSQMEKVEVPVITLVTEAQVRETLLNKDLQGKLKEAMTKIQTQDVDGGIAILQQMLQLKADDLNARYLLGACYNRKGLYFEALAELNKVVELNPAFAGAHYQMGVAYQRLSQLPQAHKSYIRALELDPELAEATFNAGLVDFQLNQVAQAQVRFEKARQLRGDEPEILEMLGRCHLAQGHYAEALQLFETVLGQTKDPEKMKVLGDLIDQLKKVQEKK